jgi:hypothetical protein
MTVIIDASETQGVSNMVTSEVPETDNMIKLVELNLGKWKPFAVVIIDINFKVWSQKGEITAEVFEYFKKFPISEMHPVVIR